MLGIKDEWKILRTGKPSDFWAIGAITGIFILIVALNVSFLKQGIWRAQGKFSRENFFD